MNRRPRIAVTVGDPGGIGPEVVRKALADKSLSVNAAVCVLGPSAALGDLPPEAETVEYPEPPGGFEPRPNAAAGELSFRLVEDAIAMAQLPAGDPRRVDAIVTGPISKLAWKMAGHGEFPGHTELFGARFGGDAGMMFVGPSLRVILATAHVPLMRVGALLTPDRVGRAISQGHEACVMMGVVRPRIAVCGLNPHAGEGGLLGDEDQRVIAPAIAAARAGGKDAHGPLPGDTVFLSAARGAYDLVVAMYHDQGLIPVKLLERDSAVNITVGLPIIRTSPDHGTAFDIAGQGRAEAGSMKAAIDLAARMARQRVSGGLCGAVQEP